MNGMPSRYERLPSADRLGTSRSAAWRDTETDDVFWMPPGQIPRLATMIRIEAPHFCAGADVIERRLYFPAPIIHYMSGWTVAHCLAYCRKKGWTGMVLRDGAWNREA